MITGQRGLQQSIDAQGTAATTNDALGTAIMMATTTKLMTKIN